MTDYSEEQRNEIEALESIYPEELRIISDEPYYSFTVDVRTDSFEDSSSACMTVSIRFEYVPSYPDEPPLIELEKYENLEEEDSCSLLQFLKEKAEENLGMVMVFTLVSEASEWLNTKLQLQVAKKKEDDELKKKREEEEERKKFEGTRVSVETFMSWKAKFDKEMSELNKEQVKEAVVRKLTGRELFEKDHSLVDSDLQFFQEGDEEVKVDESLFQELDDLELLEDDDDKDCDS